MKQRQRQIKRIPAQQMLRHSTIFKGNIKLEDTAALDSVKFSLATGFNFMTVTLHPKGRTVSTILRRDRMLQFFLPIEVKSMKQARRHFNNVMQLFSSISFTMSLGQ